MPQSSLSLAAALLLALSLTPAMSRDAPSGDWRVDRIDGKPPVAGSRIFMRFDAEGEMSGRVSGMAS